MPRVIHFEIPADDPERAIKFYEEAFGWKIEKWEGPFDYWLVMTGEEDEPGINGAIMSREMGEMIKNAIGVDNFDEYAEKIEKAGGKFLMEKETLPGVGAMAAFEDTEGNISVLIEPEPMPE
ncbi:VOC family protein [Methanobacterium oryzae]|uniref:VOC family protein n=1 Tax=Methanobacterium oryzae TaxID=69540 RepID=UPI003D21CE6C